MKSIPVLFYTCLLLSIGSLAAGFTLAGRWNALLTLAAPLIAFVLFRKRSPIGASSAVLLLIVIHAGFGIKAGLPAPLMILACTAGLASWDLAQFQQSKTGHSAKQSSTALDRYHINALLLAAGSGLLLAITAASGRIALPFGVIALLALAAVGGLIFGVRFSR